jgi:hypothetical protein
MVIVCLSILFFGCKNVKNEWTKAKQSKSVDEIVKFIKENPNSEFDKDAKILIDSLDWLKCLNTNTIDSYKTFINAHANSQFDKKALTILDSLEWNNALNMNTEEVYKAFIKSYPNSQFYNEANSKIPHELSGVVYIELQFKNGSGFFADAVNVFYFIDVENCKKYVLDNRASNSFKVSSAATPCKIVGYIKDGSIICTSLFTNIEESVKKSIMDSYTKKCKVK